MTGTPTAADPQRDLLARLGLPAASSLEDVETAYRGIVAYLARAPRDLRPWARQQSEAAGQAYALLIDPAEAAGPDALEARVESAVPPGGPATPPARRDVPAAPAAESRRSAAASPDVDALIASAAPDLHPDVLDRRGGGPARPARPAGGARIGRHPIVRRLLLASLVGAALLAVAVVGYGAGAPPAAPLGGDDDAAASSAALLDEAAVAALMARIQDDPSDTEALFSLGDEFYAAGDFSTAARWLGKVVALEPDNVQALVALGAAAFNSGDDATAADSWLAAIELDPDNVEAHYDLGFLYYTAQPQDIEAVRREWGLVVELAPGTEIASTVKAHLDALAGPSAAPASPSAAPAASPSPAP